MGLTKPIKIEVQEGTGNTATADKLTTPRAMQVNLGSSASASFDGSADVSPGVRGTLGVANGGTGNTSVDTTPTSGSTKMVTSGGVFSALSGKAASSHTHAISNITDLQTTLDGKAASSHNHSASNITSGTLPVARGGTGNTSVDTTPTSGSTKMVTSGGVYSALSGKAASSHNHSAADITSGILSVARGGTGVASLAALAEALGGGGMNVVSGTYTGTSSSTISIPKPSDFNPKLWACFGEYTPTGSSAQYIRTSAVIASLDSGVGIGLYYESSSGAVLVMPVAISSDGTNVTVAPRGQYYTLISTSNVSTATAHGERFYNDVYQNHTYYFLG